MELRSGQSQRNILFSPTFQDLEVLAQFVWFISQVLKEVYKRSGACLTNMQSFVSQPVWALTKLRTPAEPESGPGNAAVKFHGTLSKKRITWCSPACPPPACLAKHYPNYPMLPVPKLCIKYNLLFWNEPKTKSINIHKFFVSLHSFCFLWCSKVRTILKGS